MHIYKIHRGIDETMKRAIAFILIASVVLSIVGCAASVNIEGAQINEEGHLILSMSDGSTIDAGLARGADGKDGLNGRDGSDGKDGKDGKDGIGISKAAVNDSGNLMIRLSDDTLINAGHVAGANGKDGKDGVDGKDGRDGSDGRNGTDGRDGTAGKDGKDGVTPCIGDNGNWWIGEEDTGVKAGSNDFIYNDKGKGTTLLAYVGHDYDVVLPKDKKTEVIGESAFALSKSLTSIVIPNTVVRIEGYAFERCPELDTVKFEEGTEALVIGNGAFSGCRSLKSIELPTRISEFGNYVFGDCTGLTDVTLPLVWVGKYEYTGEGDEPLFDQNTSNGAGCFSNCTNLKTVKFTESLYPADFSDIGKAIPYYLPDSLFYKAGIEQFEMPDGVIAVGKYAFSYSQIRDITVADSVYWIMERAFSNCYELRNIDLKNVGYISEYAFYCCSTYDNGTPIISEGTFIWDGIVPAYISTSSYVGLESVKMEKVGFINDYAFAGCYALKSVEGMENSDNLWLCEGAFMYAPIEGSLNFKNLGMYGVKVFYGCSKITSVNAEHYSGNKYYHFEEAFKYCTALESVRLGDSLDEWMQSNNMIGKNMFEGCTALKEIDIDADIIGIGAFNKCTALERVTLRNVYEIDHLAFGECTALKTMELPESVTDMYGAAFGGSGIETLICGRAVPPMIHTYAGYNILSKIENGGETIPSLKEIKVPAGSAETYKSTANWSNYADRIA